MKKFDIFIVEEAENDIIDIYEYIVFNDSVFNAEKILLRIEEECEKLSAMPFRGRIVPELKRINIISFHEIIFNPFRIIYQIFEEKVFIHAVLDSRRDLEIILYNRLVK